MQRAVFVLLAIFAASCYGRVNVLPPRIPPNFTDGRIVGGENTEVANTPYQVSVRLFGSHMCGGSILRPNVVITAAHCIYKIFATSYTIQHSTTVIGGSSNVINANRVVVHEAYDGNKIWNDVALIFLAEDIPLSSNAQAIQLPNSEPAPGTAAIVSGWGTLTENGASPSHLQKVEVSIVAADKCKEQYADVNEIVSSMLCAGVENGGKDACQGDSGGPLVIGNELVGIVSWGVGCARSDYAGVYSNVYNLRSWIEQNVN